MRIKNKNHKKIKIATTLMVLSGAALSPMLFDLPTPVSAVQQSASTTISVVIDPVISITTPNSIDINITPTPTGAFNTGTGTVNVSTNNGKGYTTYVTSKTTDTDLSQPAASGVVDKIPSISQSNSTISGTGWGWSADGNTFNPVKQTGTVDASTIFAKTTSAATSGSAKTITVGASATTSIPVGAYSNTLLFTAVANQ